MLKDTTDLGTHLFKFGSQLDLTTYSDPTCFKKQNASFIGEDFDSWEDADKKTKMPWEKGQEVLAGFVKRLSEASLPQLKSRVRYTEWSYEDGDDVDLDRMAQGLPYMRKTIREQGSGPGEMTIIVDTTTPWHEQSENILWRGAVAIALTQILEEKGYRVELWAVNGSKLFADDFNAVMTATCLKHCSDPLDASTLIGTVSGWFYRSVVFTLLDTICHKEQRPVQWGYGSCYTPKPKDLDSVSMDQLRLYASGVFSFNGALDMIIGEVERVMEASSGKGESDQAAN